MEILKSIRTQKSITLTEVMVSMSLITLLAGTVLALLIQNTKMGQTIDYHYVAVNIAKGRIDRIRELRRDKGFSCFEDLDDEPIVEKVDRNGGQDGDLDFTRITTITTNFDSNPNLTKVKVTVSFKRTGDVSTTTITLTSLLSPYI